MKVAGMQPYLFPYIGYFQLINASDLFVLGDELQYINKGWINRNNILIKDNNIYRSSLFTFPIEKSARLHPIVEGSFSSSMPIYSEKFLHTIKHNYQKAPYFNDVFPILEDILSYPDYHLAPFIKNSIEKIMHYLEINTKLISMSDWPNKDFHYDTFSMQDRVIHLCRTVNANEYINSIGGTNLYSKEYFLQNNITLSFLQTNPFTYTQFDDTFVANLSIIDVMMFNSIEDIQKLLNNYTLI